VLPRGKVLPAAIENSGKTEKERQTPGRNDNDETASIVRNGHAE
jgi:hypothetical protein